MSQRVTSPFMQGFEQLPSSLPIFPLPNALLTPGGRLPLNIFESRYLKMVRDAMKTEHLIGMIQPKPEPATIRFANTPAIYETGCVGRITDYSETDDGRLEIVLSGLCRFTVKEEIDSTRGYRVVIPDWAEFEADFNAIVEPTSAVTDAFINALRHFLDSHNMPADWDLFEKLSINSLVNSLINVLPIDIGERQILLEADTLENRVRTFTAILAGSVSDSQTRH